MFYSHQLLARKAPMGQIWMAATMHAKINRRKLDQLNIIKICEEILNPSVPMALRLSGILMGGVVIVYGRKVKLLYDDVTRMLVENNEARKTKSAPDPTVLPKGRQKAKYEAVTLQDNEDMEIEQPLHFSNAAATTSFTSVLNMGLDSVDEAYININPDEDDLLQHHHHHQADMENITLVEDVSVQMRATDHVFNRNDRFDTIEEEDRATFTQSDYLQVPTLMSPLPEQRPQGSNIFYPDAADISQERRHDHPYEPQSEDRNRDGKAEQDPQRRFRTKRKAKGMPPVVLMDTEQTIISGHIYQNWIRCSSDIVLRRGRKRKMLHPFFSLKVSNLMELPPVALISAFETATGQIHYPAPLLDLWRRCSNVLPQPDSASRRISSETPQEPLSPPARERPIPQDTHEFVSHSVKQSSLPRISGDGFQELQFSIEKGMPIHVNMQHEDVAAKMSRLVTPGSSGSTAGEGTIPSASSGQNSLLMDMDPELPLDRSKIRHSSSSRKSSGGLDPVYEENPWQAREAGLHKLRRISEYELTPATELIVETGLTQTPVPSASEPWVAGITRTIHTHLKMHFDAPDAPRLESLNQLAHGMNRKKAAQLFYHTCVLATSEVLKVEQKVAYGDIFISRGRKM
ncbi:sister chromatid cohesion 1 protein 1 [Aristolochia californica]|uniref:sister chromatid cohesion 1 protein 1 n=1 Tax=Aristolochia californica TaxID=171875 RepID=UPI0035E07871